MPTSTSPTLSRSWTVFTPSNTSQTSAKPSTERPATWPKDGHANATINWTPARSRHCFSLCGPIHQQTKRRASASSTSRPTATACATRSSGLRGFALRRVLSKPAARLPSALAASALVCTGPSQALTPSLRCAVASSAVASRTSGNAAQPLGLRRPHDRQKPARLAAAFDLRRPSTYPLAAASRAAPVLTILTYAPGTLPRRAGGLRAERDARAKRQPCVLCPLPDFRGSRYPTDRAPTQNRCIFRSARR